MGSAVAGGGWGGLPGAGGALREAAVGRRPGGLRSWAELVKPRMVFLLSYVALASGAMHRPAGAGDWLRVSLATLAVALGSMGCNAITACLDRDIDAVMERTRSRPVPQGRIPARDALVAGAWLLGLAAAAAATVSCFAGSAWALFWLLFGAADNVLVYSAWLKRRTPLNIVAGAPAGGAPAAVAASALSGSFLDLPALLLAALVVLWTPVHIWSLALLHRGDYRRAKVPMLPAVVSVKGSTRCIASASVLLVLFSVALGRAASAAAAVGWLLAPFHLAIMGLSLYVLFRPTEASARWLFKYTSPYLAAVCTALALGALLTP
ncbi:MAG: UbiA family prenyltransferase [Acetobacteraceae bacterium]|nr:UbiA family prenyltransferase [Acetobacteraceae bacterium]